MIEKFFQILFSFGKIGFTSLGGGHSMLKLIEYEAVASRHWLTESDFITMLGSTFLFPGLTAVKLSALIGYEVAGIMGMIFAVLSLNLPGLLLSVLGYQLLSQWNSPIADKLVVIVQYGALALLAAASFSIAKGVLTQHFSIPLFALATFFFIGLALFDFPPVLGLFVFLGAGYLLISTI